MTGAWWAWLCRTGPGSGDGSMGTEPEGVFGDPDGLVVGEVGSFHPPGGAAFGDQPPDAASSRSISAAL